MATNFRIAKLLIAVAFVAGGRQATALAQPESTKVAKDVPANGEDDTDRELLQRIGADWDQRRKAFSHVKYVAKGEARFMRGCYNDIAPEDRQAVGGGDLPAEDRTFPTHRTLYLTLTAVRLVRSGQRKRRAKPAESCG